MEIRYKVFRTLFCLLEGQRKSVNLWKKHINFIYFLECIKASKGTPN